MTAALRLSATDDRLAHGIVKSTALATNHAASRLVRKLSKAKSLVTFLNLCADHFSGRVVASSAINKLTGSRAKAWLIVLEPSGLGDYCLLQINWRSDGYPYIYVQAARVVLSRHAIARYLHRSSGCTDVNGAIAALLPYLWQAMSAPATSLDGTAVKITGPAGQLCLRFEDNHLIAKTWLANRTAPEMVMEITQPVQGGHRAQH